jgi:hypothetical protein
VLVHEILDRERRGEEARRIEPATGRAPECVLERRDECRELRDRLCSYDAIRLSVPGLRQRSTVVA